MKELFCIQWPLKRLVIGWGNPISGHLWPTARDSRNLGLALIAILCKWLQKSTLWFNISLHQMLQISTSSCGRSLCIHYVLPRDKVFATYSYTSTSALVQFSKRDLHLCGWFLLPEPHLATDSCKVAKCAFFKSMTQVNFISFALIFRLVCLES